MRPLAVAVAALALAAPAAARVSLASWYGPGFYGARTACGLTVTRRSMFVAHRTLPCFTRVLVCWRRRCARGIVGDRGPYVAGREIDLGPGMRAALHFGGVHLIRWWVR